MAHKIGDKVKGKFPPHGGSWKYDSEKDECELVEAPTAEAEPAKPAEPVHEHIQGGALRIHLEEETKGAEQPQPAEDKE